MSCPANPCQGCGYPCGLRASVRSQGISKVPWRCSHNRKYMVWLWCVCQWCPALSATLLLWQPPHAHLPVSPCPSAGYIPCPCTWMSALKWYAHTFRLCKRDCAESVLWPPVSSHTSNHRHPYHTVRKLLLVITRLWDVPLIKHFPDTVCSVSLQSKAV